MPKLTFSLDCYPGERALVAYAHGEPMLHLLRRITHRLLSSKRNIDPSTAMLLVNGQPIDDYHKPIHLSLRHAAADSDKDQTSKQLLLSYFAVRCPTMDIHVQFDLDHVMRVRTTSRSTLYEFKTLIMYLKGIPCVRQSCFILEGRRLSDDMRTLKDYGVRDGCRLHLVLTKPRYYATDPMVAASELNMSSVERQRPCK